MALILNIDTSSSICSVSLAKDGENIKGYESANPMDHSSSLAPFVDKCLSYLREKNLALEAVSVSDGPGSYTGLRIGLSLAKGVAFALDIPLITISTLKVMATRAIFTFENFMGDELIIPMIDARRMEVYTAVYDSALNELMKQKAVILTDLHTEDVESQKDKSISNLYDLPQNRPLLFIGDGTMKFQPLFPYRNAYWLGSEMSHAKYMAPLSEKYFKDGRFSDVAYSVPNYLKEYMATKPKSIF